MKKLTKEQIKEELKKDKPDFNFANLSDADLRNTNLSDADLRNTNLYYADLRYTNLSNTNLRNTNLSYADLRYADLRNTNLSYADLRYADLRYADLRNTNLSDADLRYADLRGADLRGAKTHYLTIGYHLACPEEGSFVGWKKCADNVIVKLLITEDAKRSSATTRKCRASKVEVLDIIGADLAVSQHDSDFIYKVGDIKEVTDFNEDRWSECASGIHFFLTREEAEQW